MTTAEGTLLWEPSAGRRGVSLADDKALHRWSVDDLEAFWASVWDWFAVDVGRYDAVLADRSMPGARWFPGARLNYAEHALRLGPDTADTDVAVLAEREDGHRRSLTWGEPRAQVGAAAAGLRRLGVGEGFARRSPRDTCPTASRPSPRSRARSTARSSRCR